MNFCRIMNNSIPAWVKNLNKHADAFYKCRVDSRPYFAYVYLKLSNKWVRYSYDTLEIAKNIEGIGRYKILCSSL
jgi:hypothetical protein